MMILRTVVSARKERWREARLESHEGDADQNHTKREDNLLVSNPGSY